MKQQPWQGRGAVVLLVMALLVFLAGAMAAMVPTGSGFVPDEITLFLGGFGALFLVFFAGWVAFWHLRPIRWAGVFLILAGFALAMVAVS